MSLKKEVKIIQNSDIFALMEEINKLMAENKCWDLITVDSIEARHAGIGEHTYTAWLQYEREV